MIQRGIIRRIGDWIRFGLHRSTVKGDAAGPKVTDFLSYAYFLASSEFQWVRGSGKRDRTPRELAGAVSGCCSGGNFGGTRIPACLKVRHPACRAFGPCGPADSEPVGKRAPRAPPPVSPKTAARPGRGARPPRCGRALVLRPRRGRRSRWKGPGALAKPRCRPAIYLCSLREQERPARYVKLQELRELRQLGQLGQLWITSRRFPGTPLADEWNS
jgi:hypothetical protein